MLSPIECACRLLCAEALSAFLIISRYRFPPSPCAASDDLYSHVMNPVSPVSQQKPLFTFINSLLPQKISKLNPASHDVHPVQWRWQWCAAWVERRRKRGEREQLVQQQCELHSNFVIKWDCTQIQCVCEALWSIRMGGFADSVLAILV